MPHSTNPIRTSPLHRIVLALCAGLALLTVSACGPTGPLMAPEDSLHSSGYGTYSSTGSCSSGTPNLTTRFTGNSAASEFRVCTSDADFYSVTVTGTVLPITSSSQATSSICFFPGEYYAASNGNPARVLYKSDLYGAPMMSCVNLGSDSQGRPALSEAELRFNLTNYNFLYAVRIEDSTRMKSCLISADERLCPPYARGLFRAASSVPTQSNGTQSRSQTQ